MSNLKDIYMLNNLILKFYCLGKRGTKHWSRSIGRKRDHLLFWAAKFRVEQFTSAMCDCLLNQLSVERLITVACLNLFKISTCFKYIVLFLDGFTHYFILLVRSRESIFPFHTKSTLLDLQVRQNFNLYNFLFCFNFIPYFREDIWPSLVIFV